MRNYIVTFSTGLVVGIKAANVFQLQQVTDSLAASLNYGSHSIKWQQI